MYKYRGRHTRIVLGEPLPAKSLYRHAREHFKVTKARISQLMKIADVLPEEFMGCMGRCEDQTLVKKFSGKILLRIANLESLNRRQEVISQLMERVGV